MSLTALLSAARSVSISLPPSCLSQTTSLSLRLCVPLLCLSLWVFFSKSLPSVSLSPLPSAQSHPPLSRVCVCVCVCVCQSTSLSASLPLLDFTAGCYGFPPPRLLPSLSGVPLASSLPGDRTRVAAAWCEMPWERQQHRHSHMQTSLVKRETQMGTESKGVGGAPESCRHRGEWEPGTGPQK